MIEKSLPMLPAGTGKISLQIFQIRTVKSPHTIITGRASLARRSTPEAAKPVPPCQNTEHDQLQQERQDSFS